MIFALTAVVLGPALMLRACNRGIRPTGTSWFAVLHALRFAAK